MYVKKLKKRLCKNGVDKTIYSINGSNPMESLALEYNRLNGKWGLYSVEPARGTIYLINLIKEYEKEEDACNEMYQLLMTYGIRGL